MCHKPNILNEISSSIPCSNTSFLSTVPIAQLIPQVGVEIHQIEVSDLIHNEVSFRNNIIYSTKKSINIMFGQIPLVWDVLLHTPRIDKISIMQSILGKMIPMIPSNWRTWFRIFR